MRYIFEVEGETVSCMIKTHAQSKRIKITIHHGRDVSVSVPRRVSHATAIDFLHSKSSWIIENIKKLKAKSKQVSSLSEKEVEEYKHKARILLEERALYFATNYGVTYKSITVKDQKTRWGSCSSKGNLNFSYKLALLPPQLSDYIIVHELCHLIELNHGEQFWDLVAKTFPHHKELRKELRGYGYLL